MECEDVNRDIRRSQGPAAAIAVPRDCVNNATSQVASLSLPTNIDQFLSVAKVADGSWVQDGLVV
jgi:hypothetical protein